MSEIFELIQRLQAERDAADQIAREAGYERINTFRDGMGRELLANERKGGWRDKGWRHNRRQLAYHTDKLITAVRTGDDLRVAEFAADVANEAFFVADDYLRGAFTEAYAQRAQEPDYVPPTARFWLYMLRRWPLRAALGEWLCWRDRRKLRAAMREAAYVAANQCPGRPGEVHDFEEQPAFSGLSGEPAFEGGWQCRNCPEFR